jgi:signal transduction histidine kinase
MNRFWNSLQFRLFATFGIIAMLVLIFGVVSGHARQQADIRARQMNVIDNMVKNGYIIVTLFHRYIDVQTDSERATLKKSIDDLMKQIDDARLAFRNGGEEQDIAAIDAPELNPLLDDVDSQFQQFKSAMQNVMAAKQTNWESAVAALQSDGIVFNTYGQRLENGIEFIDAQEQQNYTTAIDAIVLVSAGMLILATIVVIQSVRAINGLVKTTQSFADSNFKVRANLRTVNEIARVGSTFNEMADRIDQLVKDLEQQVVIAEQARARAEQSDQVKSSFLASMSHELRTPLNAIINFSKFVMKGVMGPVTEQQTDTLNKVVQSGKHLLNLINDVLDISKIESGSLSLFIEPNIDVAEILHQTCELSEALLEGKPVDIQMDIADELPHITADRQRLRQIVTNVLSNACKFTDEGFIKISAYNQGSDIQISVQDTGPGIAAEDYDLVFESFKQTNSGLRQGNGTGLGMPISKSLIEALGGKLWFESEVGKGSTFFITLPIKSEEKIIAPA